MNKKLQSLPLLLALCAASTSALAALSDPPYFNLWGTAQTNAGNVAGNGMSLLMCGTSACGTQVGASDHNYAIINALTKNTGKGSGNIDPFLRFDQNTEGYSNAGATTEAAFNTNYRCTTNSCKTVVPKPTNPNQNMKIGALGTIKDPNAASNSLIGNQAKDASAGQFFNHAVEFSTLVADNNGYFHFMLDINEPAGTKSGLRLDELAFFTSASDKLHQFVRDNASTTTPDSYFADAAASKKIWDMDFNRVLTGGGTTITNATGSGRIGGLMLDGSINDTAGSGDYDMEILLHKDLFAGTKATDYVYLYNFAGVADAADAGTAGAGFEEWALDRAPPLQPPTGVPEPSTLALALAGIACVGWRRRCARR